MNKFILFTAILLVAVFNGLSQSAKPVTDSAQEYTCSMHREVRSNKPGKCPKCGMDLIPVPKSASTQWTCPMHPEIVLGKAGKCPKCGMDLVNMPTRKMRDSSMHMMHMDSTMHDKKAKS